MQTGKGNKGEEIIARKSSRFQKREVYYGQYIYPKSYSERKGGERQKGIHVFVDLKTAFDTIEKEELWRIIEEKGINKGILERIKTIYEETKVSVKIKEENIKEFWTYRNVRQGCILSPFLFNLYIADLDKYFLKRGE